MRRPEATSTCVSPVIWAEVARDWRPRLGPTSCVVVFYLAWSVWSPKFNIGQLNGAWPAARTAERTKATASAVVSVQELLLTER